MVRRQWIVFFAVISCFICVSRGGGDTGALVIPAVYTEKLDTPDLQQTDPAGDLPGGGQMYCAPVCVSNSFGWLAAKGFGGLVSGGANDRAGQFETARVLGSRAFMNTSASNGTGPVEVIKGVVKYLEKSGYDYELKYQGWRSCPGKYRCGTLRPSLEWIKKGLVGDSAVWLNLGWYRYNARKDEYKREGGHWVTLVGYGIDAEGNENEDVLIIHDPAAAGGEGREDFVEVERLESGKVAGFLFFTKSIKGLYRVKNAGIVRNAREAAILDGAVVLRMRGGEMERYVASGQAE